MKYFNLNEFTFSQTAARYDIDNTPPDAIVKNLNRLCDLILDPLRKLIDKPIQITSGYRCIALNRMVGSKDTSHHTFGLAADIKCSIGVDELMEIIVNSDLPYEQVIKEFDSWVHVSVSTNDKPKRQALIIDKKGTRVYR